MYDLFMYFEEHMEVKEYSDIKDAIAMAEKFSKLSYSSEFVLKKDGEIYSSSEIPNN